MQSPSLDTASIKEEEKDCYDVEKKAAASADSKSSEDADETTAATSPLNRRKTKRRSPWAGRFFAPPRDPYPSLDEVPYLGIRGASFFSKLTFQWVQPLLVVGYSRTLVATDLAKVTTEMECGLLADKLMASFDRRCEEVDEWNKALKNGTFRPGVMRKAWWKARSVVGLGKSDGTRTVGIAGPISEVFGWFFWSAGVFQLVSDVATITSPLVTKELILFGSRAYYHHRGVPGYEPQSVGYGIGLAIVVMVLQLVASFGTNHFFARSYVTGVLLRGALIAAIYRKATVLSGKSRTVMTNGRLVNHVGTDVSRIDRCTTLFHFVWTTPIQLIIIVVILLVNLGPSSLVGIGFLFLTILPQGYAMTRMFEARRKIMEWTDRRAKLIQELLGGMRILKYFAWESPYLEKIQGFRRREMQNMRGLLVLRAASFAIFLSTPVLATVLSFGVYSATGHAQDPAVIFTSLTLFNLATIPFVLLPMALSSLTDGYNASQRIIEVFLAETRTDDLIVDGAAEFAVQVDHADFQWEGAPPKDQDEDDSTKSKKDADEVASGRKKGKKGKTGKNAKNAKNAKNQADVENIASPTSPPVEVEVMQLKDIDIKIPRGQLCAVVGPVGAGKSSFLQALVADMKRIRGSVTFSGSISYSSQIPWIQSTTLRNNILFGQPFEQGRYDRAVKAACLEPDIAMLPSGDATEIGEKGVTLSGGQKARVSLARALYFDADIVLLDDPLSAVDAHVGKHLFEHAICDALQGKTRILVTHAIHFLPQADRIITIDQGRIKQDGTFAELLADKDGPFAKLVAEFGGQEVAKDKEDKTFKAIDEKTAMEEEKWPQVDEKIQAAAALMQEEDREEGAVSARVYLQFFKAARGQWTVTLVLLALALMEVSAGLSSYWLVWWQEDRFNSSSAFYSGMYAMLGVSQAMFSFLMGLSAAYVGYNASRHLHTDAIHRVLHAPMSFFDTTPLGRIMNRFSKDIDTIDNELTDNMRAAAETLGSILVAFVLVSIIQPYFLIVASIIAFVYVCAAGFYRASAREIKRLDNILRSSVYAHFSECLTGLATIRAFGETEKSLRRNEKLIDIENRAYYMTALNQRWLGLRLDLLGVILVFAVALFGVGTRTTISPSQTGLMLSYILSIQGYATWLISQLAQVENESTSVERVLHYSNELEQEAPVDIDVSRPPSSWPDNGSIEFRNVMMRYRPELPHVLKRLNFSVQGGSKIGIVGRTGAGKSSILQALFRIIELDSGSIVIDGVDISRLGLHQLREKLAIIPQDPLLFSGTLRSNLDPFGSAEDRVLWDALRRAHLVNRSPVENSDAANVKAESGDGAVSPGGTSRFTLDMVIEDEGLNLSVGERSLVSLARALVKDSRVIVLDEATASVDLATDAKIQETIRSEFNDKTLLIIAHRLRTIIDTDRVLVMSDGQVAEFDTPLNLYHKQDGIFRSMCDRSNISEEDVLRRGAF